MKYQVERSRPFKICCLLGSSQGTYLDSFPTLVEKQYGDFCKKGPGLKGSFRIFEMEQVWASEAHKTEILEYKVLKV